MSDHGHALQDAHAAHAPAHDHRKDYFKIFIALTVLTAIEVALSFAPIDRRIMGALMIGLALTKAALVGLYFMHLKYEKRSLLWLAALPLPLAGGYALFLMLDAANLIRSITAPFLKH